MPLWQQGHIGGLRLDWTLLFGPGTLSDRHLPQRGLPLRGLIDSLIRQLDDLIEKVGRDLLKGKRLAQLLKSGCLPTLRSGLV